MSAAEQKFTVILVQVFECLANYRYGEKKVLIRLKRLRKEKKLWKEREMHMLNTIANYRKLCDDHNIELKLVTTQVAKGLRRIVRKLQNQRDKYKLQLDNLNTALEGNASLDGNASQEVPIDDVHRLVGLKPEDKSGKNYFEW